MAKLIWTDEALAALESLTRYLAEKSPAAAASVSEGIWRRSQVLKEFPQSGWRHDDIPDRDVRSILYGHYRVVYEIFGVDEVRVTTVLHTSIDISRLRL